MALTVGRPHVAVPDDVAGVGVTEEEAADVDHVLQRHDGDANDAPLAAAAAGLTHLLTPLQDLRAAAGTSL